MLKVADLAARADFDAGPLHVSPGRRLVEGPAGSAHVEPIVMKVFLVLLDAAGAVVTRNELFDRAWGGVFVGDDSLNRAIARVRKIASDTAPGLFKIETIPRTGYRVTGAILQETSRSGDPAAVDQPSLSRRSMVIGGAAATAVAGAATFGVWQIRNDRRFDGLLRQAEDVLGYDDTSIRSLGFLRQAVALQPTSAKAQGLLAYAIAASLEETKQSGNAAVDGEEAAATAVRIDPGNADAKVARVLLQRATLDLITTEDRLRAILTTSPNNNFALRLLWNLLQSVGRSNDALALVRRAIAVTPLAAANNFPLAQMLWITGRTAEADRVVDRALQLWPQHPYVRWARFTIFAFTNRARAALSMLENDDLRPQNIAAQTIPIWRASLVALDDPTPARVEAARVASLEAVKRDPRVFSRQALLCLSALGEVDAAFETANMVFAYQPGARGAGKRAGSTAWAFAPFLFVPPTASLRADRRFRLLADGIGLTAYWAKRGVGPDYLIAGL